MATFGEALHAYIRQVLRLSLRDFAAKSGVSLNTLVRVGDMRDPAELMPATIQKIIVGCGWTTPEFNDWWEEEKRNPSTEADPDVAKTRTPEDRRALQSRKNAQTYESSATTQKIFADALKQAAKPRITAAQFTAMLEAVHEPLSAESLAVLLDMLSDEDRRAMQKGLDDGEFVKRLRERREKSPAKKAKGK